MNARSRSTSSTGAPVQSAVKREPVASAQLRGLDAEDPTGFAAVAPAGAQDHVDVLPALLGEVPLDPDRTDAFICGPEVMMKFTVRALNRAGLPDDRIHLSLERNMGCAVGLCGRCQLGPEFVCKDGPVFTYARVERWLGVRQL